MHHIGDEERWWKNWFFISTENVKSGNSKMKNQCQNQTAKPGFYPQKSLLLCLVEYERPHPFWGTRTWKDHHCKCLPDKWSIMSKMSSFGKWMRCCSPLQQDNAMACSAENNDTLCKTNPPKIRPLGWNIFSTSAILPFSQRFSFVSVSRTFHNWQNIQKLKSLEHYWAACWVL